MTSLRHKQAVIAIPLVNLYRENGQVNVMDSTVVKLRVLLADDHMLVRECLRILLGAYDDVEIVGEAADGEEAVALAVQYRPDIVVMDLNMPKLNGAEATVRIKHQLPDVIVVGLSIQQGAPMEQLMKQAGASAFVTKELAETQLYPAMKKAMKLKTF